MKVKKLGLSRKRGEIYVVRNDGKVVATVKGKAVQVARAKLVDPDDFLYFIDDDGDLAREYRSRRQTTAYAARSSATKPASAKLETRELFDKIEELLFPPDSVNLSNAGHVEDPRAGAAARKIYTRELKRLATAITRALGPAKVANLHGYPGFAWELRGRWVRLSLESEDSELPGSIELSIYPDGGNGYEPANDE